MKILVTGANGFVGQALCRLGGADGHEIIACQRSGKLPDGAAKRQPVSDITDETALQAAMQDIDCVIHLVARTHVMRETAANPDKAYADVNVAGTEAVARAAISAGVRRVVFMSSIKVNGEATMATPYRSIDKPDPEDSYGRTKLQAEQILREICDAASVETVVLRPPLVYGAGVGGNFASLVGLCARPLPLPFGSVTTNRRSLIAVENLASAALLAATHPDAAGEIFLVRDGEDLSTHDLVGAIRTGLDKGPGMIPVPPAMLKAALTVLGKAAIAKRLLGSLQIDDTPIRDKLGWQPPLSTVPALHLAAADIHNPRGDA